jgi:hypothetical protein
VDCDLFVGLLTKRSKLVFSEEQVSKGLEGLGVNEEGRTLVLNTIKTASEVTVVAPAPGNLYGASGLQPETQDDLNRHLIGVVQALEARVPNAYSMLI